MLAEAFSARSPDILPSGEFGPNDDEEWFEGGVRNDRSGCLLFAIAAAAFVSTAPCTSSWICGGKVRTGAGDCEDREEAVSCLESFMKMSSVLLLRELVLPFRE